MGLHPYMVFNFFNVELRSILNKQAHILKCLISPKVNVYKGYGKLDVVGTTYFKGHVESNGRCFFICCCIQLLKMGTFEKLWKAILPYWDKKHD